MTDVRALAKRLKVSQEKLRHRLWEWRKDFPPQGRSENQGTPNLYDDAQVKAICARLKKQPLLPNRGRPKKKA